MEFDVNDNAAITHNQKPCFISSIKIMISSGSLPFHF